MEAALEYSHEPPSTAPFESVHHVSSPWTVGGTNEDGFLVVTDVGLAVGADVEGVALGVVGLVVGVEVGT